MSSATHAIVTFCAHDIGPAGNFAPLGRATVGQYYDAPEGPSEIDANNSIILDLMSDDFTIINDKHIDVETAAALLGWPVAGFVPRARQALAQHVDELEEMIQRQRTVR